MRPIPPHDSQKLSRKACQRGRPKISPIHADWEVPRSLHHGIMPSRDGLVKRADHLASVTSHSHVLSWMHLPRDGVLLLALSLLPCAE